MIAGRCSSRQAEDGIRDSKVTGVQTCALPICPSPPPQRTAAAVRCGGGEGPPPAAVSGLCRVLGAGARLQELANADDQHRSEEGRVGKECRSPRWPYN